MSLCCTAEDWASAAQPCPTHYMPPRPQDDAAATPKCEIVRHISGLLHRYFDHLEQRLGKASSTGEHATLVTLAWPNAWSP